jgi:D-cysteine desulfhydrase
MMAAGWATEERPLLECWPSLRGKVRFAALAELPTPVQSLEPLLASLGHSGVEAWDKRDDLSSRLYGGNKVRTLEALFGDALGRDATHVYSTGAYGSNHAAAAAIHAPRVGLTAGAALYPQPPSRSALANLELLLSRMEAANLHDLPHWSALPAGIAWTLLSARRRGQRAALMVPGGAVPEGALGYVSAALELAQQVAAGELPAPRTIVLAAGSNCTTAGLLLGCRLAVRLGIGLRKVPTIVAVRVTPWPVTSRTRIVGLAQRTSEHLARLAADESLAFSGGELGAALQIDAGYIGRGYGLGTMAGAVAAERFAAQAGHGLETTYSGKSAAAALDRAVARRGVPLLYWSTKTSAPHPPPDPAAIAAATPRMSRWMRRARRQLNAS